MKSKSCLSKNYSWSYSGVIDYDYERSNCSGDCSDYCRCTTISASITNNSFNATEFSKIIIKEFGSTKDPIFNYCIDRLVRLVRVKEEDFEVIVSGGYYGEEVSGVQLNEKKAHKLKSLIEKLFEFENPVKMVEFVLESEYGYLLDDIKNATDVKIVNISHSDLSWQQEYRKKVSFDDPFYQDKITLPAAIVIACPGKTARYRLIDGYHRVAKLKQDGVENFDAIMLEWDWTKIE